MDDRERLQWLPARARREREVAWGSLLHTLPLIAAALLALLLGHPEIAGGTLVLVVLTLGLGRTLFRPRRLAVPHRIKVREVGRSH